jgi:predicted nucleic acid-binding protein
VILVDTSVWVDHLRADDEALRQLLEAGRVLMHPHVLGELACGNLRNRAELLELLSALPRAPVATEDEVLSFIEMNRLMGRGVGYTDVHLLASVRLEGTARLWARDRRLLAIAVELEVHWG